MMKIIIIPVTSSRLQREFKCCVAIRIIRILLYSLIVDFVNPISIPLSDPPSETPFSTEDSKAIINFHTHDLNHNPTDTDKSLQQTAAAHVLFSNRGNSSAIMRCRPGCC